MVNQFTINLNREEGYAQREARRARIRSRITNVVATVLLLIVGFVTWENHSEMSGMVKAKERQLKDIIAKIDSLQKVGQNVSKEDVIALARLDKERVLWTQKVHALAERLPEEMVITGLKLDRGVLSIDAMTEIKKDEKEFDKVKLYMDQLRATPRFMENFDNIKFKESQRGNKGGQELLSFTVTCQLGSTGRSALGARRGRRR